MRREGFELTVGQPQVITKEIDGKKCEPYEVLVVDVPSDYSGKVIDLVTQKKGELLIMESKGDMQHLEFDIPSRGLIGLRSNMLTATAGEAVMAHRFSEYKPWKGVIPGRSNGVLLSKNSATTTGYSMDKLQDRGSFFIDAGEEVYSGMIIGEHIKPGDLVVNATEPKKLTNMRASGTDDANRIAPKVQLTLEECMEFIQKDEYLEITPKSLRMRKIWLDPNERKRNEKKPS
jgi:GTP-binding protein